MKEVIVVPETKEFMESVLFDGEIYITKKLGTPKLKEHQTRYVAPLWLDLKNPGVYRLYHIKEVKDRSDCTVLILGNSFVLDTVWNATGQKRKFEYKNLKDFDFAEIKEGLLMKHKCK